VGAGVRRIEAVTGRAAQDYIAETDAALQQAAQALNARPAELAARISALLEERKKLEHELSEARRKLATGGGTGASGDGAKEVAGVKFVRRELDGVPAKELKSMADALKKEIGSGVVSIAASADGKASLVVAVTDDLTDRLDAVALVRAGAAALGGKGGGGRPDMAQAGGPDAGKLADANNAVEQALAG